MRDHSSVANTCLLHKGQNSVQRKTFKVLPSHKQVCRLLLKNRLAVERGKPAIIVSKTQQVQFSESNIFTNKAFSNVILFTCLRSLQRRETTSAIDERRKQLSKRALVTS